MMSMSKVAKKQNRSECIDNLMTLYTAVYEIYHFDYIKYSLMLLVTSKFYAPTKKSPKIFGTENG